MLTFKFLIRTLYRTLVRFSRTFSKKCLVKCLCKTKFHLLQKTLCKIALSEIGLSALSPTAHFAELFAIAIIPLFIISPEITFFRFTADYNYLSNKSSNVITLSKSLLYSLYFSPYVVISVLWIITL